MDHAVPLPQDPVEDLIQIANVPLQACSDTPTKLLQVYVEDCCHAATQSTDGMHIPTIRRVAIHGIHALFPPTSITNHDGGKEPISQKKLAQGDGHFETSKDMIGFHFDGIKCTVRFLVEKAMAYIKEAHTVLRQKNSFPQDTASAGRQTQACLGDPPGGQRFLYPLEQCNERKSKTSRHGRIF